MLNLGRAETVLALCAAAERINLFAGKTLAEQESELAWALNELRPTSRGHIYWRSCKIGRELLSRLAEAQNWRCCHCFKVVGLKPLAPWERFATIEHAIPKAEGGADHPDNLVVACEECNKERGCKLIFKP